MAYAAHEHVDTKIDGEFRLRVALRKVRRVAYLCCFRFSPRLYPLRCLSVFRPMATLRALLRALPCRPSELPHFRAAAVSLYRDSSRPEVARELSFYFESLRKQKELNDRYFPQSELTPSERMAKLANVVGLEMPESSKD